MNLNDTPVDVVITYVDCDDPVWVCTINSYKEDYNPKRYRQWDTLKYLFRGLEKNMSFLRKVHLVVSNPEQVPEWVNTVNVDVVLHKKIIPSRFLPTFNSTTIEMFLSKIPDLADRFLYFNDDMFPVNECKVHDFFSDEDGYPFYEILTRSDIPKMFYSQCKNSYCLAAKLSKFVGLDSPTKYFFTKHSATPMITADCNEVLEKGIKFIIPRLSLFRNKNNITQYLFSDYSIMKGHSHKYKADFCYAKMNDPECVCKEIESGTHKVICLNDSNDVDKIVMPNINEKEYSKDDLNDMKFIYLKNKICDSFEKKLNDKCKYEL